MRKLLILGLFGLFGACYGVGIWSKDGDINIGLLMPFRNPSSKPDAALYDTEVACGDLNMMEIPKITLFLNMLEAVNKRDDILPNITLGYSIVDTCRLPNVALARIGGWGSYKAKAAELGQDNVTSTNEEIDVTFVVGGYNSRVSVPSTIFLQEYNIPLIDVDSTLADLSDRSRYRLFARVSASDKHQTSAIADVTKDLDQDCVHLVYSKGVYGEMGADDLRVKLAERKICVASDQVAATVITSQSSKEFDDLMANIKKTPKAKTIICFCEDSTIQSLLAAIKRDKSQQSKEGDGVQNRYRVIAGDYWNEGFDVHGYEDVAEGAVAVTLGISNGSRSIMFEADPIMKKIRSGDIDPWMQEFYENKFNCKLGASDATACDTYINNLSDEDIPLNFKIQSLYVALSAGLQGLHVALKQSCSKGPISDPKCLESVRNNVQGLYKNIISQQVDLSEFKNDQPFRFDANGEGPADYTFNYLDRQVSEDGTVARGYETLAVWQNTAGGLSTFPEIEAAAKLWPGTNITITSTCSC